MAGTAAGPGRFCVDGVSMLEDMHPVAIFVHAADALYVYTYIYI